MDEALTTLLESNEGFPSSTKFEAGSLRMHTIPGSCDTGLLQGCFWIPRSLVDAQTLETLNPVPKLSSLAPKSSSTRLKLWYDHPQESEWIGVPKFFGLSAFGQPDDDLRTDGLAIETQWNEQFKLREEQRTGLDLTLRTLDTWGGAFFIADCGFGKSVVIARLVHEVKRRCMIVVPRLTLVKQMFHDLGGERTGLDRPSILSGATVGLLQGNWDKAKDLCLDTDIVVASLDSLASFRYPASFWATFGLVVFDEAHHMAARTLSAILPHVPCKRIVGFSATPDRKDGLQHALFWLLGPTSFVFQRLPSVTGVKHTVEVTRVSGMVVEDVFMYGGKLAFAQMLNTLAADEARNAKIVALVKELVPDRKKILCISAFREHCETLATMLQADGLRVNVIHGGTKKRKREEEETANILIATYGLLEEGFDDADLDTLVLCTPRSTVQQTVGRIERVKAGKSVPQVFDIVDNNKMFECMWWKRVKFYQSRGFKILKPTASEMVQQWRDSRTPTGFVLE